MCKNSLNYLFLTFCVVYSVTVEDCESCCEDIDDIWSFENEISCVRGCKGLKCHDDYCQIGNDWKQGYSIEMNHESLYCLEGEVHVENGELSSTECSDCCTYSAEVLSLDSMMSCREYGCHFSYSCESVKEDLQFGCKFGKGLLEANSAIKENHLFTCDIENKMLVEVSREIPSDPTPFPTILPTSFPTATITEYPTSSPTQYPSMFPTTAYPSSSPTTSPTLYPTQDALQEPKDDIPAMSPTSTTGMTPTVSEDNTTPALSSSPTAVKTAEPTRMEIEYQTEVPTRGPTYFPTLYPTTTRKVTSRPTFYPTYSPTYSPTYAPTVTYQPTFTPTFAPTFTPTYSPTDSPREETGLFAAEPTEATGDVKQLRSTKWWVTPTYAPTNSPEGLPSLELQGTFWFSDIWEVVKGATADFISWIWT